MSAPSNPTAANGSKHWMVITNRLCGRKAMAHSVSVHRCWTKPPNTSKTKRHVIAAEHSSMNTNNSWMHTMWNMMNGMRLGIDFSAGVYFPFFSAGVYTKFCCIFFIGRGLHHLPTTLSPLRGSVISSIPPLSHHLVSWLHPATCSRPSGLARDGCPSGSRFPPSRPRGRP